MARWEYKVVPAPTKGVKGKGVKGPEGRFANALEQLMNTMAEDGWEFQRAETLPSVERSGLTSSTTEWRNVLVFRRSVSAPIDDFEPELLPAPTAAPVVTASEDVKDDTPTEHQSDAVFEDADASKGSDPEFEPGEGATQMLKDNGVEETSDVAGMTNSLQKLANRRSGSDLT